MTYESLHECSAKLYVNGLVILYKKRLGRTKEELKRVAKLQKTYHVRASEVKSAALLLWQRKKFKVWFLTITFAFNPNEHEKEASLAFNNWLKNLRTNYQLNNYVYVKEKGEKGNRIHYHILIDSPKLNIRTLQSSFNTAVLNIDKNLLVSNNSIRLGNNPYVSNIIQCAKYISKYVSKSKKSANNSSFVTKAYGYTKEIADVSREIDTFKLEKLAKQYDVKHLISDCFFEIFIIKGFIDFTNVNKKTVRIRTLPENFT